MGVEVELEGVEKGVDLVLEFCKYFDTIIKTRGQRIWFKIPKKLSTLHHLKKIWWIAQILMMISNLWMPQLFLETWFFLDWHISTSKFEVFFFFQMTSWYTLLVMTLGDKLLMLFGNISQENLKNCYFIVLSLLIF